jgi:mono/diheme cytochrome c family protein
MSTTAAAAKRILSRRSMRIAALGLLFVGGAALHGTQARAQGAEIFKGADLSLGEKLIAEHKCVQCHTSKVGGDGSAIYKPAGKFNTAGLMRGMVEMCNTNMNLGMFPEEVTAVAAVLNRDHYKFK